MTITVHGQRFELRTEADVYRFLALLKKAS